MSDIFISYASEDRDKAKALADALSVRSWSVWWDRKIPLGKSFEEVIEKALGESKCVIVLWSAVSVASEWVRNEASEAKRRGILVPVFLETVDAPLAFRLLNGADLRDWQTGTPHPKFDQLVEHVAELLGKPQAPGSIEPIHRQPGKHIRRLPWARLSAGFIAVVVIAVAAIFVYHYSDGRRPQKDGSPKSEVQVTQSPPLEFNHLSDLFGVMPATAVTTGFYVPDLGFRVAFITPQQSQSMLGAMPSGALVMEVESSGAAAKAGINARDIIEAIGSHKIDTVDDLRQTMRELGPGKTQFTIRRPDGPKTVLVDCPNCKPQ